MRSAACASAMPGIGLAAEADVFEEGGVFGVPGIVGHGILPGEGFGRTHLGETSCTR